MEFLSLTAEAKDLDGLIKELERAKQILEAAKIANYPEEEKKKHPEYIRYVGTSAGNLKTDLTVEYHK